MPLFSRMRRQGPLRKFGCDRLENVFVGNGIFVDAVPSSHHGCVETLRFGSSQNRFVFNLPNFQRKWDVSKSVADKGHKVRPDRFIPTFLYFGQAQRSHLVIGTAKKSVQIICLFPKNPLSSNSKQIDSFFQTKKKTDLH